MSLEKMISDTVKDALQDTRTLPIMAKKKTIASLLDVSVDMIDKLIRERVLVEEVHFTRYVPKGDMMFYTAEVLATLKPKLAKEKVLL